MIKTYKVKCSHQFNATAEQIFDTFLDPAKAKNFMFATASGKMIRAEIDAKVGGKFVFIERRIGGDAEHYGEYVTLNKPHHIQFRFSAAANLKDGDLVSIDIATLKRGCNVTLTHEVREEFAHLEERIQEGWDGILDGLGENLRK